MEFKNIAVRDESGTLILKDGEAGKGGGLLAVAGKLERGTGLKIGAEYKIVGEPGLSAKLRYAGSPGAGKYEFKID